MSIPSYSYIHLIICNISSPQLGLHANNFSDLHTQAIQRGVGLISAGYFGDLKGLMDNNVVMGRLKGCDKIW